MFPIENLVCYKAKAVLYNAKTEFKSVKILPNYNRLK